jgi:hypothetical protein
VNLCAETRFDYAEHGTYSLAVLPSELAIDGTIKNAWITAGARVLGEVPALIDSCDRKDSRRWKDELSRVHDWLQGLGTEPVKGLLLPAEQLEWDKALSGIVSLIGTHSPSSGWGYVVARLRQMAETPIKVALQDWGVKFDEIAYLLRESSSDAVQLQNAVFVSPLSELVRLLQHESPRSILFATRYFGWGTDPPCTLETIGISAGITRERVRQLVQKVQEALRSLKPAIPLARAILDCLDENDWPISMREWRSRIPIAFRPASRELYTILALAQRGWIEPVTSGRWRNSTFLLVGSNREEELSGIFRAAEKAFGKSLGMGVLPLDHIASKTTLRQESLVGLLRGVGDPRRLPRNWIFLRGPRPPRFVRMVAQMIALLGPLPSIEIRRGLTRRSSYWKRVGFACPPLDVLEALLAEAGFESSDRLHVRMGSVRQPEALHGAEAIVVNCLRHAGGPMTAHEIRQSAVERGATEAMVGYFLSQSVFLLRVSAGIYVLRGRNVDSDKLRSARKRRSLEPSRSSTGEVSRLGLGKYIATFQLRGMSGQNLYIPAGTIPTGEWILEIAGTTRMIRVRRNYLTGLLPTIRLAVANGYEQLVLRFDRDLNSVSVDLL